MGPSLLLLVRLSKHLIEHYLPQHLQVYQNLLIALPLPTYMGAKDVVIRSISIFERLWLEPYVQQRTSSPGRVINPPISPLIDLLGKTNSLPCSDTPPPPNIYMARITRDYPCNSLCRISIKNIHLTLSDPERMPSPCTAFTEVWHAKWTCIRPCPVFQPVFTSYSLPFLPAKWRLA
jgi:hypothetical protein